MADAVIDFAGLDGTATETVETSNPQETQVETTSDPHADSEGQRVVQEGQQQEQPAVDGRRGPANIRNSIKAASEALPEQAAAFKELGNAYFREQAYKQHFASPQEAASAKQLITDIGGVEGIAGMQQRVQAIEAQDNGLRDGNPEVLDAFFKDFPEGATALAPHYLDRLMQTNPEALETAIAPYAVGMLEAAIGQYLQGKVAAGDATAKEIKDWLDGQKGNAQQIKQTRQASANDPAQKRIREQQEALNKEREQLFVGQVAEKVNATATSDIGKAADPYVKQYKLGDEQKKFFIEQLGQKIVAELNADANYKKQIDIRKAAKDRNPQALADFMTSQVRERLPKAALALSRAMYGGGTKPVTSPQQNGQAPQRVSAGRIFVAQRPPNEALDLSYPNAELDMIKGFGKRKSDGQLVQWRR